MEAWLSMWQHWDDLDLHRCGKIHNVPELVCQIGDHTENTSGNKPRRWWNFEDDGGGRAGKHSKHIAKCWEQPFGRRMQLHLGICFAYHEV